MARLAVNVVFGCILAAVICLAAAPIHARTDSRLRADIIRFTDDLPNHTMENFVIRIGQSVPDSVKLTRISRSDFEGKVIRYGSQIGKINGIIVLTDSNGVITFTSTPEGLRKKLGF